MSETTIINNHVVAEIKLSLSHMIQSTELFTRINPTPSRTQTAQPVSTPTHVLSPSLLPPSIPTSSVPNSTSTPYPIKYLTYTEMQQRRDRDLCLICDEKDTSAHRCQTQRILFILPDDDSYPEQQPIEMHSSAAAKQLSSQGISLHALNHASNPKAMQLSDAYSSAAAIFKALGATQALNSTWHMEQKWTGAHNMFAEMTKLNLEWADASSVFAEMSRLKGESKVFIFDPGGIFKLECTFDLEDKVGFERWVMIRLE